MLKKNKLSSAVTLAFATVVGSVTLIGLTGCNLSESTSFTGGSSSRITNPTGTVVGNVQDTNGNPMADVSVYLGGSTVKTDVGGNYRFNNVGVVNAPGADGSTSHSPLLITIAAPTGYLGATVTVEPNALVDGSNTNEVRENTVTLFIDGFIASAGTALIPQLNSTVTGVLRNSTTEEPISNTLVTLDLVTVGTGGGTGQEATHDGISAGYQTFAYSATTGADGSFSIANVPDDSQLRFEIEGHTFSSLSYNSSGSNVDTTGEDITTNVGNLLVTVDYQVDDVPPYVVSVTGVQNQQAATGQLNDDIDGTAGLVVNFSEAMDATQIDANSVVLYDATNENYITVTSATMAADGRSMTITTTAAIPAGAQFDINFLRADFMDLSGNNIDAVSAAVGPLNDVDFDTIITSAANATDVYRMYLRIFQEINTTATSVTLAQLATDATGTDDDADIQASNAAFADVWDGNGGFDQLNSADDDDTNMFADAETRLNALAVALGGTSVTGNVTRVNFTPVNASSYDITVKDENGVEKLLYDASSVSTGVATITLDTNPDAVTGTGRATQNEFVISALDGSTSTLELVIQGVVPGDVVEITPFDDFSYSGTSQALTLLDNVEPTTVLQQSYGVTPVHSGVVTSVDFGEGGQLANTGAETIGTPYLNVTPQLIDNLDANGANLAVVGPAAQDNAYLAELYDFNAVDATNCNLTTPCIAPATGIYDATAYAAMATNLARTIGVSMSEDLASVGTPTYNGTAVLSGFAVHNDVTLTDAIAGNNSLAGLTNADLINVNVDNVITLAADDGSVLNFQGQITDTAGNVASVTNNAKVVVRDAMPPMVTSSTYSGTNIVINFNEPVVPTTADSVTIGTVTFALSQTTVDAHPAGGSILTIPASDANWIAATTSTGFYGWLTVGTDNLAAYEYNDGAGAGVAYHGALTFSSINDVNGNDWTNDNAGIAIPKFAYASTVATAFGVTEGSADAFWTTAGAVGAGQLMTFTYTATHAIDMSSFGAAANATSLTDVQIAASFAFSGGALDTTINGTAATLSANRRTLTVKAGSIAVINPADTFGPSVPVSSDYDGAQSELAASMLLTKP